MNPCLILAPSHPQTLKDLHQRYQYADGDEIVGRTIECIYKNNVLKAVGRIPFRGGEQIQVTVERKLPFEPIQLRRKPSLKEISYLRTKIPVPEEFVLEITETTLREPGKEYSTMNEVRYVYDANGHKKSVIVPVELWERTLQVKKPQLTPCNPQEYNGIYRDRKKTP